MDGWGTANRGVAWMEDEGFRGPRAAVYSALLMIASCNTQLLSNELQLHIFFFMEPSNMCTTRFLC